MAERFEDHVGVAHILARQGFARAQAMGSGLEYLDIFQEVSFVFAKVADKFDPTQGFKFSTFLTRCVYNHFNNTLFKKEGQYVIELGMTSIEDVMDSSEEPEDFFDRHDCGRCDSPEDILEFRQSIAEARRKFSPVAQTMLSIIERPPEELVEELQRINWHRTNNLGQEPQEALGIAEVSEILLVAGLERGQILKAKTELLRFARKL